MFLTTLFGQIQILELGAEALGKIHRTPELRADYHFALMIITRLRARSVRTDIVVLSF